MDLGKDHWTPDKAYQRVANEMRFHKSFLQILLSIFKVDLMKIKNRPVDCIASCDIKNIDTFAKMMREKFTDDAFLISEFLLVGH